MRYPAKETAATFNITQAATSTKVTPSTQAVDVFSNSADFTATVSSTHGLPQDGFVQFFVDGVAYGNPVPFVQSPFVTTNITITNLPVGGRSVVGEDGRSTAASPEECSSDGECETTDAGGLGNREGAVADRSAEGDAHARVLR